MADVFIDKKNKIVIKKGNKEEIRLETEKTKKAYKISKKIKEFSVPKVLDYDDSQGVLKLEYIENIKPLSYIPQTDPKIKELIKVAGISLSIIHNNLNIDTKKTITLPKKLKKLNNPEDYTFIHGDYNLKNLQYDSNNNLIILDWGISPLINQNINYAPLYWDVAWFIVALFLARPPKKIFFKNYDRKKELAELFLKHYEQSINKDFNRKILFKYIQYFLNDIIKKSMKRKNYLKQLLHFVNKRKLTKYIDSFYKKIDIARLE